jgi:long-subunit fatty acid transport protein
VRRKFSNKISASLSYAQEAGGGPAGDSLFTISNGDKSHNLGLKYSLNDNAGISAGYSRPNFGKVSISSSGMTAVYSVNSANTIGVKFKVNF